MLFCFICLTLNYPYLKEIVGISHFHCNRKLFQLSSLFLSSKSKSKEFDAKVDDLKHTSNIVLLYVQYGMRSNYLEKLNLVFCEILDPVLQQHLCSFTLTYPQIYQILQQPSYVPAMKIFLMKFDTCCQQGFLNCNKISVALP